MNWTTIHKLRHIIVRAKKNLHDYTLYLDINYNGKRSYENLKIYLSTVNKKKWTALERSYVDIAYNVAVERQNEILNNNLKIPSKLPFLDMLIHYVPKTYRDTYLRIIKVFELYLASQNVSNVKCSAITPELLVGFAGYLESKGYKASSCKVLFGRLKVIIKNAEADNAIAPILAKVRPKFNKDNRTIKYLTAQEIEAISKVEYNTKLRDAFLLSAWTALRYSDISRLTYGNIVNDKYIEIIIQKTKKKHKIFLINKAKDIIARQTRINPNDPEELIFPKLNYRNYKAEIKKIFNLAEPEISDIHTFHSARHTSATLLLNAGVPKDVVQGILGHSSVITTEIYAKLVDTTMDEAIAKLDEI